MSNAFQNMDPNSESVLDDDHTKFRARFERLSTFSLGYNPNLLQASPASSTVSRSPLRPVKIRTDWSRPDLDDDGDSELNSSGTYKFCLDNLEDPQNLSVDSPERNVNHLDLTDSPTLNSVNVAVKPSPPSLIAIAPCGSDDMRRMSGSRFSDILNSSSDSESDMELSSTCGAILLERPEGEPDQAQQSSDTETVLGESGDLEIDAIISTDVDPAAPDLDESAHRNQSSQVVLDGSEMVKLVINAEKEEAQAAVSEKVHEDESTKSVSSSQCREDSATSEREPENALDFINVSPIKKLVSSRSVEGTPARALFPENARSAEGTPIKVHSRTAKGTSVYSSLFPEGTPSTRHRAIDQVQSEVPELALRLSSKHDDWTRRMDALKRISRFTGFHMSPSALAEACLPLLDPIVLQLQDLRSQIVKQACITIGDLSECLGFQFHVYARRLFPRLLDLLRIAKKVMSSAGDECLRRIITHSHVDAIDVIIQESAGNKSPIVRCRCVEYIILALQSWNVIQLTSYQTSIGFLFSKICSDSTKDVRTAGKLLFSEFARIWPDYSRDLFKAFDRKLQKGILADYPLLQDTVAFSDEQFTKADSDNLEMTPARLSLAEIKTKMRRESITSSSTDAQIVIVEKVPAVTSASTPISCSAASVAGPPKTPIRRGSIQKEGSSLVSSSVPNSHNLVTLTPRSPSLSFKFDQSHPSIQQERGRLVPALSPIPPEFLEGFPMPAPIRSSIPSESRPKMPEPSPLVKHSSRRFTSRVVDTPVNGKFDEADNDDDSSSTASSCPTIEQSFNDADDGGQISVSSSIAAESVDVLAREVAPFDVSEPEELDRKREKMIVLESRLQYLRTMATSVFDEGESPVRTIEIHYDLTSASTVAAIDHDLIQEHVAPFAEPQHKELSVLTPQRSELNCDTVLKVGDYSFETSTSPKDVLTAVLSTPSSDRVFKSPDHSIMPAASKFDKYPVPGNHEDDDDSSFLRSILFILLSLIIFAFLFHGLPTFLRPGSDDLVSKPKLHYSSVDPKLLSSSEASKKFEISIRDSAELSDFSDHASGYYESAVGLDEIDNENDLNDQKSKDSEVAEPTPDEQPDSDAQSSDFVEDYAAELSDAKQLQDPDSAAFSAQESTIDDAFTQPDSTIETPLATLELAAVHDEAAKQSVPSKDVTAIHDDVDLEGAFKFMIAKSYDFESNATNENAEIHRTSDLVFEEEPHVDFLEDLEFAGEGESDTSSSPSDGHPDSGRLFTPKLAWLYSFIVAAICWITYRIRTVSVRARPLDRDPDFDLTGVTMAPEWDINLDSVLPSGPSPLPHPGGTDYQKWNHIKKDGTSMTLFSPLRRTLRIRRPRRPTQF